MPAHGIGIWIGESSFFVSSSRALLEHRNSICQPYPPCVGPASESVGGGWKFQIHATLFDRRAKYSELGLVFGIRDRMILSAQVKTL